MPKDFHLQCKDLGNECEKKFTGYNEGEVLMKCVQHIMWAHKVEKVTPELNQRIRALIQKK
jgi:predicted small metal-binding protein